MYFTYFCCQRLLNLEKVGVWSGRPPTSETIIDTIVMIYKRSDEWQYEEQTMFLNRWRCIDFLAQVVYTDSDVPLRVQRGFVSEARSYLSIPHH